MTVTQALDQIENRCDALGIRDCFGERVFPIEAVVCVARYHGALWDQLNQDFEAGKIEADLYAAACLELIAEYDRDRFRKRIERNLEGLMLDQRELS